MADELLSRRAAVKALGVALVASHATHFVRWSHAATPDPGKQPASGKAFEPRFFAAAEYATLVQLADRIIPSDELSPGATDAGVAEFIDFRTSHDPSLQVRLRSALIEFDRLAEEAHGRRFAQLTEAQQNALLRPLAYKKEHRAGQEQAREYFDLVRDQVIFGYYTSKVGMESLQVPALIPAYGELPDYSAEFKSSAPRKR